jgi:trimethylamine:corrinoid methyltransferase-like protein
MAFVRRFLGTSPTDGVAALIDDIVAVGPGGHFLGRRSTREAARAGVLWQPSVMRRGHTGAGDPRALVTEAAERAAQILETHRATPLADDVVAYVEEVIARYAHLVGAAAPRRG